MKLDAAGMMETTLGMVMMAPDGIACPGHVFFGLGYVSRGLGKGGPEGGSWLTGVARIGDIGDDVGAYCCCS